MSDLDVLLDEREFVKRALSTIDNEEFKLMSEEEKRNRLIDIYETRNKVLNYLGYERIQTEKGIWKVIKITPPEEKELEDYEKWLDKHYQKEYDKFYKDKED